MKDNGRDQKGVLLLIAGMKGAIGSTLSIATKTVDDHPDLILPYLMTAEKFPHLGNPFHFDAAGWDISTASMKETLLHQGVLEKGIWASYADTVDQIPVKMAPDIRDDLQQQVNQVKSDIREFTAEFPERYPVLINLLPAGRCHELNRFSTTEELYKQIDEVPIPDLAYVLGAVESGVPVVNFTPNEVEIPAVMNEALERGVPITGRDGKTGQTYFKVVLASAFRARNLLVNGWYSLNILGNSDGENLKNPVNAACKLNNKTDALDNVLGYKPGIRNYGKSTHQVCIDYYAPRGDAKEAWDVIDFESIFGLSMSLRMNLQGRDSILASPMILDLARWMAAVGRTDHAGPVPELGFFFKKTVGASTSGTFEDQIADLDSLEQFCQSRAMETGKKGTNH